jgi:hypothetical protein
VAVAAAAAAMLLLLLMVMVAPVAAVAMELLLLPLKGLACLPPLLRRLDGPLWFLLSAPSAKCH